LELRQLRTFLAIAELGSFSKAASMLGVAQPALSRQLRLLEDELGARLLYRHGRGASLTEAGKRFRDRIEPALNEIEQARGEAMSQAGAVTGAVSVAMPPSFSAAIGSRLTADLLRRRPGLQLHILEGFTGHIAEWLVAGRVDVAIVNSATCAPSLSLEALVDLDLFLTAPAAYPGSGPIPMRELANVPLILPGRHHGARRELEATAQRLGIALRIVAEVDALSALADLVRLGAGATVLPSSALPSDLVGATRLRRVVEPEVRLHFMLACPTNRPETPASREVIRALRAEVDAALAEGRLVGRRAGRPRP
jgi:LysR family nitrogen assimilation transcriptional regulator